MPPSLLVTFVILNVWIYTGILLVVAALFVIQKEQEEDEGSPLFGAVISPDMVFRVVFLWPFILAEIYGAHRDDR